MAKWPSNKPVKSVIKRIVSSKYWIGTVIDNVKQKSYRYYY